MLRRGFNKLFVPEFEPMQTEEGADFFVETDFKTPHLDRFYCR
jgi:hypothetical protein